MPIVYWNREDPMEGMGRVQAPWTRMRLERRSGIGVSEAHVLERGREEG